MIKEHSMVKKMNPHMGSSLDDLLREMGILEEVNAAALTRVIALQITIGDLIAAYYLRQLPTP
jgi:hypothetical protein